MTDLDRLAAHSLNRELLRRCTHMLKAPAGGNRALVRMTQQQKQAQYDALTLAEKYDIDCLRAWFAIHGVFERLQCATRLIVQYPGQRWPSRLRQVKPLG